MNKDKFNRIIMVMSAMIVIVVAGAVVVPLFFAGGKAPAAPEAGFSALMDQVTGQDRGDNMQDEDEAGFAATDGSGEEGLVESVTNAGPSCEFGFLVGLQGEEAVEKILPLDRPYRVIAPFMAVTQDYRAERINLLVDESGIVYEVSCG